jgi:methyl-coenzyme M reductase beta subunit
MAKYTETIDLYDDGGKLLKSGVALDKDQPAGRTPASRR